MIKTIDTENHNLEMINIIVDFVHMGRKEVLGSTQVDKVIRDLLEAAPAVEPAQSAAEPVAWTTTKPERDGVYYVRGYSDFKSTAVVEVKNSEFHGELIDFVKWIASLRTGGLIQGRATSLLAKLGVPNETD